MKSELVVQLHLKPSHWHVVPILGLSVLLISIGNAGHMLGSDWWSSAKGCALLVAMAIAGFYLALPFIYMMRFKESYVGEEFFGWTLPRDRIMELVVALAAFLTYFAFVCRIILISAAEVLFAGILLAAVTGNRLIVFVSPESARYWWVGVTAVAASAHTWAERRNLGRAGVILQGQKRTAKAP